LGRFASANISPPRTAASATSTDLSLGGGGAGARSVSERAASKGPTSPLWTTSTETSAPWPYGFSGSKRAFSVKRVCFAWFFA